MLPECYPGMPGTVAPRWRLAVDGDRARSWRRRDRKSDRVAIASGDQPGLRGRG